MDYPAIVKQCILEVGGAWELAADAYGETKTLEELGFDSLSLVELIVLIGQQTKIKVPRSELADIKTPEQILAALRKHAGSP